MILKNDYPGLNLWQGDVGIIWALYKTEPPAYEATFRLPSGEAVDMTVSENEIAAAVKSEDLEWVAPVLAATAATT